MLIHYYAPVNCNDAHRTPGHGKSLDASWQAHTVTHDASLQALGKSNFDWRTVMVRHFTYVWYWIGASFLFSMVSQITSMVSHWSDWWMRHVTPMVDTLTYHWLTMPGGPICVITNDWCTSLTECTEYINVRIDRTIFWELSLLYKSELTYTIV